VQSDRRVALIIGCAAYSLGPLDNPVRDATALEACFKRLGFDEVTLVSNPKLAQLGRKLADLPSRPRTPRWRRSTSPGTA